MIPMIAYNTHHDAYVDGWGVEPRRAPPPSQGVEREETRERDKGRERQNNVERKISVVIHVPYVGLYKYIP